MLAFESHKNVFPQWQFGEDWINSIVEHDSQVRGGGSGERRERTLSPETHKTESLKRVKETAQQNRDT